MTKVCPKCNIQKPLEEFSKKNKSKDGLQRYCKVCVNTYLKDYQVSNRLSISQKRKDFYDINKEAISARAKQYYHENKSVIVEKVKEYRKKNIEKVAQRVKTYQEANKEKFDAIKKEYRDRHQSKCREASRKSAKNSIDTLGIAYVKRRAIQQGFSKEAISAAPDILDFIKTTIKIKRICKRGKNPQLTYKT